MDDEAPRELGRDIPGSPRWRTLCPGVVEFKSPGVSRPATWQDSGFRCHGGCFHGSLLFSSREEGEAWEEANTSTSLCLSFPLLRVSVFQKQKFAEVELGVYIKQHSACQSPIITPWRVSACSLASTTPQAEPRTQLMLECGSVAFAAWECHAIDVRGSSGGRF